MARTLNEIQNQLIVSVQSEPDLNGLTSDSRRAIWRLWTFVQAVAILALEQLIDVFKTETELKISQAIPNTSAWLLKKIFDFQYSATIPQVLQLVDYVPQYPTINDDLKIITRASVSTTLSNVVNIKVAKSEPPTALNNTEKSSLQSYINTLGVAGVSYQVISLLPDRMFLEMDIFYDGQYTNTISTSVTASINGYLFSLDFNGKIKLLDLEIAIRNTTGVTDVLTKNVKVRSDATTFVDGSYIVQNNTVISRIFPTVAGYVILEDSIPSILNFIPS
jgi:hypothetical protein